jgi:DNA-binding transcriptional ArsR family regulator
MTKRLIKGRFPVQRLFPTLRILANEDRLAALWALSKRETIGIRELLAALEMDPEHEASGGVDRQAIRRYMRDLEALGLVEIDTRPNNALEYTFNRRQMEDFVQATIKLFSLFGKK